MRLRCAACGREHPEAADLCPCGGPLDLEGFEPELTRKLFEGRGLWRFLPALPLAGAQPLRLGEGGTPLVHVPELGARFKCEYLQTTGSFKDRGAAVLLTKAKALGARRVVEDSSGNAGAAIAAYAARASLPADIFVPEWAVEAKLRAMQALGATIHKIPGPRRGVTDAAVRFCREQGAYFASHVYPPWFLQGTKTMAYELAEDAGFRGPDAVVAPAAMGTVLIGLRKGFAELQRAGLIQSVPRLYAAQASGFTPLVRALHGGLGQEEENRLADGLLIAEPPRLAQMVEAVQATGGDAASVAKADTERAMAALHRRGLLVEPSSATALAALERFRAAGAVGPRDDVAVVLTGRFK
ncbi:MAG TPA: pyridoxal-phosphate dependent enzyme [Candidatus Thermoplasmatota archaeon]|jgi:threonine synthase|nr:pyridoxal-phosphate dependent enzyme [Candidatus Thermoplasmatota archaeon]